MDNNIIDPDDESGLTGEKFFSIAILVLIIVAIGGFAIVRSDVEFDPGFLRGEVPEEEEMDETEEQEGLWEEIEEDQEEEDEEDFDQVVEVEESQDDTDYEVMEAGQEVVSAAYRTQADHGDGRTHVARRVAKEHLKDVGTDLSAEQMVYVEDYIQKNMDHDGYFLELGEEVEISQELVEEAVEEAEELSQEEINNLSQFVTPAHNL